MNKRGGENDLIYVELNRERKEKENDREAILEMVISRSR
jgi:hypothetical protein